MVTRVQATELDWWCPGTTYRLRGELQYKSASRRLMLARNVCPSRSSQLVEDGVVCVSADLEVARYLEHLLWRRHTAAVLECDFCKYGFIAMVV